MPAGDWIGFLHRDNEIDPPAKGWANHATVMGYYLHRIKDERTLYRGQEIRGGTHSFLRGKDWHRVESERENELTYRITPEDFSRDGISAQGLARPDLSHRRDEHFRFLQVQE